MRLILLVVIVVYVRNTTSLHNRAVPRLRFSRNRASGGSLDLLGVGHQQDDDCAEKPADLVFVLDGSSSIWNPDFKKQLAFVSDIVDSFTIGDDNMHIGVLTFATGVNVELTLDQYVHGKEVMKTTIMNIQQPRGETHTEEALRVLRTTMFSPFYSRPGIPHIGIVITDGASADTEMTAAEAIRVKEQGITMFAIGVGRNLVEEGVQEELNNIASGPDYVYTVESYGLLDRLKQDLADKACQVTTTVPSTTTTTTATISTTTRTTTVRTTLPPQMIEGCEGQQPLDVLFSVPDEAGIQDTELALDFIQKVVDGFQIGPNKVQAGLTPRLCIDLDGIRLEEHDDKGALQTDLARRGLTSTDLTQQIEYMLRKGFTREDGARQQSRKTAIMIVDNVCMDPAEAQLLAEEAKAEGIIILVIGVGPYINHDQLTAIANSPDHVYFVNSYKYLMRLPDLIQDRLCRDAVPPIRPPQMIEGCEGHRAMDILLAAPDESNIRQTALTISFLQNITENFWIGDGHVQVGLTPRVCVDLDGISLEQHDDRDALKFAISQRHLSSTFASNQLQYMLQRGFTKEDGARTNAKRFALLMVDNALADPQLAYQLADDLKAGGVTLMVVGIGPYAEEVDLRRIASSDDTLFMVDSYERLGAIKGLLLDAFCRDISH